MQLQQTSRIWARVYRAMTDVSPTDLMLKSTAVSKGAGQALHASA